jgi:predicted nucleic acid-binding protein
MSDKFFVDTNILVYAHDPAAGHKHQQAQSIIEQLWNSSNGVLSTQVLQELCVTLRRKISPPLAVEETRRLIEDYLKWEVIVNTAESVVQALDIEIRYGISFWDALVIHSAERSGAEVLYSEDLGSGQTYGSVRLVNPFTNHPGSD